MLANWVRILDSLPSGNHASIFWVSKTIPKKVRLCDEPSSFSIASGMPSCEHTSLMVLRLPKQTCKAKKGVPLWENHQGSGGLETYLTAPLSKTGGLSKYWRTLAQTVNQMEDTCRYILDCFIARLRGDDQLGGLQEAKCTLDVDLSQ